MRLRSARDRWRGHIPHGDLDALICFERRFVARGTLLAKYVSKAMQPLGWLLRPKRWLGKRREAWGEPLAIPKPHHLRKNHHEPMTITDRWRRLHNRRRSVQAMPEEIVMTQQLRLDTSHESLAALLQVTAATHAAREPRAIAAAGLDRAIDVTGMTGGSIWLRDGDQIICLATRPAQPGTPQASATMLRVIDSGQAEYGSAKNDSIGRASAIVPLCARGECIGVLAIAGAASQPPRGLLDAIADALACAIQQARLDEQVAAQGQRLRSIQRQHDELITIISHDLKNPMASIKGYADLLLRRSARNPEDPNRRGLQVISEQIVRMNSLLDKLLDLSRITAERLRIDRRPADLAQIVAYLVSELRATTGRQALVLEGAEDVCIGAFDVGRISQAIGQILSNAITYSSEDSPVVVRLEHTPGEAIISVTDQGIGIPAAEHERIFEPFFRASNVASRAGMGMGLFVAQQILARHDGRIWFESTQGQGSTFSIALPIST
jgi:signal transduction histidine kinase